MTQTTPQFSALAEQIRDAAARRQPLAIRGGNSKAWYGRAVEGETLDMRPWQGVLAYDPTELVITACAGTPLRDIEALLAEHGQMLAFEPPHFSEHSTVGGTIAAGLAGPRRPYAGSVRDFVLGAGIIDGQGQLLEFGGQVMKNVAGYDVSRVLAGSLGCLGVITHASLKVLPRPFAEESRVLMLSEADALRTVSQWCGRALPVSAASWHMGRLIVRFSGAEAAVREAVRHSGGEELRDAGNWWRSLRDQAHAYFQEDSSHILWRLSLPATAPALALNGKTLWEWGGAQRWLRSEESAEAIRAACAAAGGHATAFRGAAAGDDVFSPLSPALMQVHQRLKQALDPQRILNPGRLYKEL